MCLLFHWRAKVTTTGWSQQTRVYWPNTKISRHHAPICLESNMLRSSILICPNNANALTSNLMLMPVVTIEVNNGNVKFKLRSWHSGHPPVVIDAGNHFATDDDLSFVFISGCGPYDLRTEPTSITIMKIE